MRRFNIVPSFAIGFIPFLRKGDDKIPPGYADFAKRSKRKSAAMDLLFSSGNTPTGFRDIFATEANLKEFVRTKDYRGLLALQNIFMDVPATGIPVLNIDSWLTRDEEVGFTPYRLSALGKYLPLGHAHGVGELEEDPALEVLDDETAYLSHYVSFRIGRFGNLVGRFLTGNWAPFVWMRVEYFIQRDGSYILILSGSCIPTQVRLSSAPADETIEVKPLSADLEDQGVFLTPDKYPQVIFVHDMKDNSLASVSNFFACRNTRADKAYSIIFAFGANP